MLRWKESCTLNPTVIILGKMLHSIINDECLAKQFPCFSTLVILFNPEKVCSSIKCILLVM